jgi:hypothetical protein
MRAGGGGDSEWNPYQTIDPFLGLADIPNQDEFFDRGRDGGCFAEQNDSGTLNGSLEPSEMCRHRPPILTNENSPGVRGDP